MIDPACQHGDLVILHIPDAADVMGRLALHTPTGGPFVAGPLVIPITRRHDRPHCYITAGRTVHHVTISPCNHEGVTA